MPCRALVRAALAMGALCITMGASEKIARAQTFGGMTVQPGVVLQAVGVSGGPVALESLDPSCHGAIARVPDHVLVVPRRTPIAILVQATQDASLVLRAPDGRVHCNDASRGRAPGMLGTLDAGTYGLFIASDRAGVEAPYRLTVAARRVSAHEAPPRARGGGPRGTDAGGKERAGAPGAGARAGSWL